MGELYGTCALLAAVLFFVLLQKFESRFGKVDKELGEIKKRMDDLLKAQEKMASGPVRAKEDVTAETLDNTDILPYVTEELPDSTVTALKEEKAVEEKAVEGIQPIMAETTPQKLNASLEKESAEATLQETSPEAPLEIPSVSKRKQVNYEKFIGENLFGKIGILVFVIGVGFFVKYAIDKDWINETLRTVLGFLTGSALLVVAERLQKKYRTFSSLLAGGAFAVFYLTVAIAFHFYHLFPQTVAFIILIATTLFMSILSILYDRRELAIISLVGGFLAPFLVSTGNGNYLVLFTYMSILNLGMFGLSIYMKWGELPVIAFVFTYVVMGIFLLTGFTTGSTHISVHLFIFATLFYFIFLLPILSILRIEAIKKNRGLLLVIITNNFIYLLLGILFLRNMELAFKSEGLLSLFIAIINLVLVIWLRMSKKDYKFLIYAMLGLVLTFVSITIPIQLDGNYITLFWAAEMVLLLWLYVKSKIWIYERATLVLMGLTLISYLMDDLVKSSQKALENQALRDQVSSYEREIMLQNENMEALRSFRHDMKRHFAEISVLASTGEIEQIKNYVSAMENNLVESRRLVDSGNTALDTVLNYMLQRAVDKKIQLNVKVVVPSDLKLSAYDMNIIFGNLLENAIEAQKDVKNPSIDLEINYLMDSLVVEISNRCLQKVIFKGGLPVTTKQSVREHGYGLKNVKKVLDKYISTLDFECSDERFTVKILMKI